MTEKIALIWGLTQAVKKAGCPGDYLPVVAILIGILLEVGELWSSGFIVQPIVQGALNGLIATGIVSVVDDRIKKINGTQ